YDLGRKDKQNMKRYFHEDFQKRQKFYTLPPTSGGMTAANFRELLVIWLKRAHSKRNPDVIKDRFKKCGFYNALNGSENHLITVRGAPTYNVNDEKMDRVALELERNRSLRGKKRKERKKVGDKKKVGG